MFQNHSASIDTKLTNPLRLLSPCLKIKIKIKTQTETRNEERKKIIKPSTHDHGQSDKYTGKVQTALIRTNSGISQSLSLSLSLTHTHTHTHRVSLSLSLSLSHSFTHLKDVRLQKNGANEMQCLNPPNFRVDFVCTLAVSIHKISKSNSAEEKEIMMIRKSKIFMDYINKYFLLERSFKFLKMSIAMK